MDERKEANEQEDQRILGQAHLETNKGGTWNNKVANNSQKDHW